jgi:hypothetical protein
MSVRALTPNSVILLRDQASLDYLTAGGDDAPGSAFARLTAGNLSLLQPSAYFMTKATGIPGYHAIKCSSGKFLKVSTEPGPKQDRLTLVDTDPASETVVDKSSWFFSFLPVPLSDAPQLFVLATYYNMGMTLQQPGGPGTDLIMAAAQMTSGTAPELAFEIGVTSGVTASLGSLDPRQNLTAISAAACTGDSSSSSGDITPVTTNTVDPWAIALLCVLGAVAAILLGYLLYMATMRGSAARMGGAAPAAAAAAKTAGTATPLPSPVRAAGASETQTAPSPAIAASPAASFRVPSSTLLLKMAGTAPLRRVARLTGTQAPDCHSGSGSFGLTH